MLPNTQPGGQDERHLQCMEQLKELHAQSIPFIEARDMLLKKGYTSLEILNGAYLFERPDPHENPTLEQQNLNTYMREHPEKQEEIIDAFTTLEQDRAHVDKEARTIHRFGSFLRGYIDANYVLGRAGL